MIWSVKCRASFARALATCRVKSCDPERGPHFASVSGGRSRSCLRASNAFSNLTDARKTTGRGGQRGLRCLTSRRAMMSSNRASRAGRTYCAMDGNSCPQPPPPLLVKTPVWHMSSLRHRTLKGATLSACGPGCVKSHESGTITPFSDGRYGWDASLKARTDPN
jgi:hypothetical protein